MRKSLCVVALVLAATIAPNARADATYTYNFIATDGSGTSLAWTLDDPSTAIITTATTFTTGITPNFIGSFFTKPPTCPPITSVTIDPTALGFIQTNFGLGLCEQIISFQTPLTGDGTYYLNGTTTNGTLVVSGTSQAATPEPSSIALMLAGIGFLLALMRR